MSNQIRNRVSAAAKMTGEKESGVGTCFHTVDRGREIEGGTDEGRERIVERWE